MFCVFLKNVSFEVILLVSYLNFEELTICSYIIPY